MLRPPANLRFLLPIVVSGLVSFALCAVMAAFLVREQQSSVATVQENIDSYRAAADLEESLDVLVTLLEKRVEGVTTLNDRISQHIALALAFADQPEEIALINRVDASFGRYLALSGGRPQPSEPEAKAAVLILEGETVKACQELRVYNARRIDES